MDEKSGRKSASSHLMGGIVGILIGFVLVGVVGFIILQLLPPAFVNQLTNRVRQPSDELVFQPSLPATWTPSPTASPTLIPTHTLTATPGPNEKFISHFSDIDRALYLMKNEKYAEALLIWDEVIADVPEYANAYYQRGLCYLGLTDNQRYLEEYYTYAKLAYDDFTTAIEIAPPHGDYYGKLNLAIDAIIGSTGELASDINPYLQESLEAVLTAYDLGYDYPWGNRFLGTTLYNAGYCEEALEYSLRVEIARGEDAYDSPTLTGTISDAYQCLGQYQKALNYALDAMAYREIVGGTPRGEQTRLVKLYYTLGRYQDGFEIINGMIEESPSYAGWRYYLRAMFYYQMGEPELAYQDLETGYRWTWGRYGYRTYVLGLLALDEGDEESALYWLQLAEATTIEHIAPFVYAHIREEIDKLGGELLYPTPQPSPTWAMTPTPVPAISDEVYATPTPYAQLYSDPVMANYTGTGMFGLFFGETEVFMFRPRGYHTFQEISSLDVILEGENLEGQTIEISLMKLDGSGFSARTVLQEGINNIPDPALYVSSAGYFYVTITNKGPAEAIIKNISIHLSVVEEDGTQGNYGAE